MKAHWKEISTDVGEFLISYKVPVAFIDRMGDAYKTNKFWSISITTHMNEWLGTRKATLKPQSFFDNLLKNIGVAI